MRKPGFDNQGQGGYTYKEMPYTAFYGVRILEYVNEERNPLIYV